MIYCKCEMIKNWIILIHIFTSTLMHPSLMIFESIWHVARNGMHVVEGCENHLSSGFFTLLEPSSNKTTWSNHYYALLSYVFATTTCTLCSLQLLVLSKGNATCYENRGRSTQSNGGAKIKRSFSRSWLWAKLALRMSPRHIIFKYL